jgi:M61 glycyl aminopeptidase
MSVTSMSITAALAVPVAAAAQDPPKYSAVFDAEKLEVGVKLCLAQAHPRVSFAADSDSAMHFIHDARRDSGRTLDAGEGEWDADDWRAGECLSYRADLAAIAAQNDLDAGMRLGDDLVGAPQLWLLRPDVQGDANAELGISLPPGWSISAPWRAQPPPHPQAAEPSSAGALGRSILFSIANTPANWSAAVAIGHFDEERIELPGGVLRLTILHGADAQQRTKLHDWLAHVSRAVLSAYGRLPLGDVQVLMLPISSLGLAHRAVAAIAARPVHFGQSIRGEGNALELLVDPSRPAAEFDADWIAVHELSHLMHPYLGDRGSWLAEGLATYYQNILRARAGLLTPAQAWDRMRGGFADASAKPYHETLEEAAENMHRSHGFDRIYWSGAAYWLTVDRDLRRASGGKLSMELALSRFRDCCLPAYRGWRPEEFVAKLDALLGVKTFSQRYREFADMREFPDWKKLYAELGIRIDGEHLAFDAAAADAAAREAITSAPSPSGIAPP